MNMTAIIRQVQRLFRSENGPTAVEYVVMLALILLVAMWGIRLFR
jgi:Flp pilus assembly pilin Flp